MRCSHVRRSLSAFLDGEVPAAKQQEIAAHLEGCAACRAERDALAATWQALLASPAPPVPARFGALLRQRLEAPDVGPPSWRQRLRDTVEAPARRLALVGTLAGALLGWGMGRAGMHPAQPSNAAYATALRREAVKAFALDSFAEVPPDSAGAVMLADFRRGEGR